MKQLNRDKLLFGWVNSRGVPSPVLRKTTTTVISSAGTNGQCQQTAGIGPFSGNNIICSDGSKGRRLCKVRIYHTPRLFKCANLFDRNNSTRVKEEGR
jgi:hypothetical protein